MKTGRPSDYNQEIATKICEQLSHGKSLRTVCLAEEMPSLQTVYNWFSKHPDFVEQYARAKQESADALAEEVLDIADDMPKKIVGNDKSDSARVMAERARIDTRKWLMSKMKPKKYGDKIDMTTNGKDIPTPIYGGQSTKV